MANIIDFENFMKMDVFGDDMGEKMIGSVTGALMRGGPIVWKGHVLASILCLQCMKWMEKGKRAENVTGCTPGNLEGLNRMLRRGKTCGRFRLRVAGGFLQGIGLL